MAFIKANGSLVYRVGDDAARCRDLGSCTTRSGSSVVHTTYVRAESPSLARPFAQPLVQRSMNAVENPRYIVP